MSTPKRTRLTHKDKQDIVFESKKISSPPFHGWTPSECKPDMNKQRYETDEEEFEDLNECFYEPPSRPVTPRKRPAEDDDDSGESRNCHPRYN